MTPTHVFETFRKPSDYQLAGMKTDSPDCFNGVVSIKKYRVTIEVVQEPDSVLQARLQKLWDETGNHHHWGPLQAAAKELGITLKHESRNKNP